MLIKINRVKNYLSIKTYRWSWNTCVPLTIMSWCDDCCEIGAKYVIDCCWFCWNVFGSDFSGDEALRSSLGGNGSYRLHSKLFEFSSLARCCSSVMLTSAEITWSLGCVFKWSCKFIPTWRYNVQTGHWICESISMAWFKFIVYVGVSLFHQLGMVSSKIRNKKYKTDERSRFSFYWFKLLFLYQQPHAWVEPPLRH